MGYCGIVQNSHRMGFKLSVGNVITNSANLRTFFLCKTSMVRRERLLFDFDALAGLKIQKDPGMSLTPVRILCRGLNVTNGTPKCCISSERKEFVNFALVLSV